MDEVPPFLVVTVNGRQHAVAYELLTPSEQVDMAAQVEALGGVGAVDGVDGAALVLWLLVRRHTPDATFDEISVALQDLLARAGSDG